MACSFHSGAIALQSILLEFHIWAYPQKLDYLVVDWPMLHSAVQAQIAIVDHPSVGLLGSILMLGPNAVAAIAARWSSPSCSILPLLGPV